MTGQCTADSSVRRTCAKTCAGTDVAARPARTSTQTSRGAALSRRYYWSNEITEEEFLFFSVSSRTESGDARIFYFNWKRAVLGKLQAPHHPCPHSANAPRVSCCYSVRSWASDLPEAPRRWVLYLPITATSTAWLRSVREVNSNSFLTNKKWHLLSLTGFL